MSSKRVTGSQLAQNVNSEVVLLGRINKVRILKKKILNFLMLNIINDTLKSRINNPW